MKADADIDVMKRSQTVFGGGHSETRLEYIPVDSNAASMPHTVSERPPPNTVSASARDYRRDCIFWPNWVPRGSAVPRLRNSQAFVRKPYESGMTHTSVHGRIYPRVF